MCGALFTTLSSGGAKTTPGCTVLTTVDIYTRCDECFGSKKPNICVGCFAAWLLAHLRPSCFFHVVMTCHDSTFRSLTLLLSSYPV